MRSVNSRLEVRRAAIPAAGGIMSARAIARHYAALIGQGVDGIRLLSPERMAIATALQTAAVDAVLGFPAGKALGYWIGGPGDVMGERRTAFGHGGFGGSIGFADPEYGLAVGFTKTLAEPSQVAAGRVAQRVREALNIPAAGPTSA